MTGIDKSLSRFVKLGKTGERLTIVEVRQLIEDARYVFRYQLRQAGVTDAVIKAMLTKFFDAGRRSPPTAVFSSIVPGRPQSGADGNRAKRWLLDRAHKFYAEEIPATLVEVKYILETLSMEGAPAFPAGTVQDAFTWLTGHEVRPGLYRDPIQLTLISFGAFCDDRRLIQSGHIFPLDRGGRHEPGNAFLMLARSNQLQGNNTVPEMLRLMRDIVSRHEAEPDYVEAISPDTHLDIERAA